MKILFVHRPMFRILCPLFCGVVIYFLILMIYNNIEQITEEFIGQELYVCIGLSYLVQELSRFSLVIFEKIKWRKGFLWILTVQILSSIGLTIAVVSIALIIYYKNVLGFYPNVQELVPFIIVFSSISLIYISFYLSHRYLYLTNENLMSAANNQKDQIETEFHHFKQGINSRLLFESLEALILVMRENKDIADELIDKLSYIYRHILSGKGRQLVNFNEEFAALNELIKLFDMLPYRKINLLLKSKVDSLVVPGLLMSIVESIIRTSIPGDLLGLNIILDADEKHIQLIYKPFERLSEKLTVDDLNGIIQGMSIYNGQSLQMDPVDNMRIVRIPKLELSL